MQVRGSSLCCPHFVDFKSGALRIGAVPDLRTSRFMHQLSLSTQRISSTASSHFNNVSTSASLKRVGRLSVSSTWSTKTILSTLLTPPGIFASPRSPDQVAVSFRDP